MTKLNVTRTLAGAATAAAITIAASGSALAHGHVGGGIGGNTAHTTVVAPTKTEKWSGSTVTAGVFALVGSATSMSSPRRCRPASAGCASARVSATDQPRVSCDPSGLPADGSFGIPG
jgi:hypothetical protein